MTFQRPQAVVDWVSVELGRDMGSFELVFFFMAVSVDLWSWNRMVDEKVGQQSIAVYFPAWKSGKVLGFSMLNEFKS